MVEFESVSLLAEAIVVVEPTVVVEVVDDVDPIVAAPTTLSLLLLSLAALLILCVTVTTVAGAAVVGSAVSVAFVSSLILTADDEAAAVETVFETQTQLNVRLLGSGGVPALTVAARIMSVRVSLSSHVKIEGDGPRNASTRSILGLAWNIGICNQCSILRCA